MCQLQLPEQIEQLRQTGFIRTDRLPDEGPPQLS